MRARRNVWGAALAAAVLLFADVASAQPAAAYCDVSAANRSNGDPLHPVEVVARLQGRVDRNEWVAIFSGLAKDFADVETEMPDAIRKRFQTALDTLAKDVEDLMKAERLIAARAESGGPSQIAFQIVKSDEAADTFRVLSTDPIAITASTRPEVAREICLRSRAIERLLALYGKPGRERARSALGEYVTLWDNYNAQGYSQLPWELLVNGWLWMDERSIVPPRMQLVLLHPALAIETAWPRDDGLRRLDIITLEPIGLLRYAENRRTYGGVSLLVTLSASGDPGYGALVHMGKIGKVGYVYHREQPAIGKRRHGVVFSVDLYKWIGGVPQKLEDARARVQALRNSLQ